MKQFKVLDLSTLYPGPLCGHLLGVEGFTVTKVEDVKNPDALRMMQPTEKGVSLAYKKLNKNKRIVQINYRDENSLTELSRLIKETDVLIENFRPGRMDKLGLGYSDCLKINPGIVYCSISGFGANHPLSKKAAHDINILGYCGYFGLNNNFSIPPLQFVDVITAYEATKKILGYLLQGKTKHLDVSMLESVLNAFFLVDPAILALGRELKPEEFILWGNHPCYSLYRTSDNKYMALGAIELSFWNDFCNTLKVSELSSNQFDTSGEVKEKIQALIVTKTQKVWTDMDLDCFTPILSSTESKKHGFI